MNTLTCLVSKPVVMTSNSTAREEAVTEEVAVEAEAAAVVPEVAAVATKTEVKSAKVETEVENSTSLRMLSPLCEHR